MIMKRASFNILFASLMSMVGINAWADESGSCGDGVTWSLSEGTLTISYSGSGTGAMDDYLFGITDKQPWSSSIESIKAIVIEEGVTSIGISAFDGCSGLTSVTISNSVTSIGNNAFDGCSGLTSVIIPSSVTNIDRYAFNSCFSLASVTIPNSVNSIGEHAFYGCHNLTSVTLPNSVTSIGEQAFSGCEGLTSIIVQSENTIYDSRDNCNAIIETHSNTLIYGCKNTVIPNSVTSIGNNAFYGCYLLTTVNIPNSVTTIGSDAFNSCFSLTSLTLPKSVKNIGSGAFLSCFGLTSIYSLVDNPMDISVDAFDESIYNNSTLYVPDGTTSIYQACTGWQEFVNIVEGSPTGIISSKKDNNEKIMYFTIDGMRNSKPQKGLNIINGKKVIVK